MKRFIKYTALTGLLFTILGFGIAWAASRSGARWDRQDIQGGQLWIPSLFGSRTDRHAHHMDDDAVIEGWEQEGIDGWGGEWIDGDTVCFSMKGDLTVDLSHARLLIRPGEVDKIQLTCDDLGTRQDRAVVFQAEEDSLWICANGGKGKELVLEAVIPYGAWFEDVQIHMSAGSFEMTGLNAEALDVDVAAGSLEIQEGYVSSLKLQCGVGSILYTGRVAEDVDVDLAAGEVRLQLYEEEKGFNYSLKGAGGTIRVGALELDGALFKKNIEHDAGREMDLQCAAGSIQVDLLGEDM